MAGYNRIFLDTDNFFGLVTSYTNVNGIWLNPMEFAVVHSGTELGLQVLSLQGVALTEVAFSGLDLLANVGKYTVDPTTNSIILIVDKGTISTNALATSHILGMLLYYKMKSLEYFSTDALYTMDSYTASGVFLGSTSASSTSVLLSKMLVLDTEQNLNNEVGFYYHKFRRALQVSV